jgi:PHD/YefM family antitoxin component YafN of YafNO toxin-antitoxin module
MSFLRTPRDAIARALDAYAVTGEGVVKRLTGREAYPLRVGRYRVIFGGDAATVLVIYVGKRDEETYRRSEAHMGRPQIITASNGEELVVLTRPEYEALLEAAEELADIAALDAALSDVEGSKPLTAEESAELLRRS